MAHGGYEKRRGGGARKPANTHRSKALAVDKKSKVKAKPVTLKRQIRSTERLLRKDTRPDVKEALEKKLEGLKKQQDNLNRLAVEKKIFLRYRMIKFFERRKIERNIRRLEKQQRSSSGQAQEAEIAEQLSKLKEDLEYIRFFPKTEKYLSLFKGVDDADIIEKRNKLRKQIKDNIAAAAASGKDLEETGSEDDGLLDLSDDDFFLSGSSSDEADADDEWTDKSTREQASSASGKVTSGMSSDERNQKQISARTLMPPPRPSKNPNSSHAKKWPSKNSNSANGKSRYEGKSSYEGPSNNTYRKPYVRRAELSTSSTSNTSNSYDQSTFKKTRPLEPPHTGNSSNLSSNSDARKPKRKRRPKKKKQQA